MAECMMGLGAVAAAEGRAVDAARLLGAGEAALGAQVWPANRIDCERWVARARRSLGSSDYDRARAEGRTLSLEQAVARSERAIRHSVSSRTLSLEQAVDLALGRGYRQDPAGSPCPT